MSGRAPGPPNIVRLVSSYIASLDKIIAAQKQYDSLISVFITLPENPANANDFVPGYWTHVAYIDNALIWLLPQSHGLTPGAIHIPTRWTREEDYLTWGSAMPILDELYTLRVGVIADDPAALRNLLDKKLRGLGCVPADIKPLPSRKALGTRVTAVWRSPYPPVGYWVAPGDLQTLKAAVESAGRLTNWDWPKPAQGNNFDAAAAWYHDIADEIRGEEDHLSPYPDIRSLVIDQLKHLRAFAETASPSGKLELVAVEVMDHEFPSNQDPISRLIPLPFSQAPTPSASPGTRIPAAPPASPPP